MFVDTYTSLLLKSNKKRWIYVSPDISYSYRSDGHFAVSPRLPLIAHIPAAASASKSAQVFPPIYVVSFIDR